MTMRSSPVNQIELHCLISIVLVLIDKRLTIDLSNIGGGNLKLGRHGFIILSFYLYEAI